VSTILVHNAAGDVAYELARQLSPTRAFVVVDGLFVLVDLVDELGGQHWEFSGTPPSDAEKAIEKELIEANGGFDTTSVTVTKES
jgi:hypothetical protein